MKARSRSSLGFRGNEQQEENSSGLGLHVLSDVAKLLSGRGGEHTVGEGQAMLILLCGFRFQNVQTESEHK